MIKKSTKINFIYNSNKSIESVIIPYQHYLELIDQSKLHNNSERIQSSIANYNLLLDAVNELKEKGWSLTKIAKTMKTSQSHLSRLLAHPTGIKHVTLKKYMLNLDSFLDD